MTSPIINRVQYDNASNRWRESATGRFVSNEAVTGEMRNLQSATFGTLEGLTNRLYAGNISLSDWQRAVASELKDAHLAQAMFGAGGRRNMGQAEWGRVGQTLREQYGFLNNFAQQIANGEVSEAQALARIRQYGRVTQSSYWKEKAARTTPTQKIYIDINPGENCASCLARAAGSPYTRVTLPSVPGDGSTECRGSCNCTMRIED